MNRQATAPVPATVLFDRDGTLIVDVPYCGDPRLVCPVPTALGALGRLRAAGIRTGVITNQSGIGRGIITRAAVDAVNAEVERLLGPFDLWRICPHAPNAGCTCRKPRPGMLLDAAAELGLPPARLAFVGDIGADVEAALAAGVRPVLVPTSATRPEEVRDAPVVRRTLLDAVDHLLGGSDSHGAATRTAQRPG